MIQSTHAPTSTIKSHIPISAKDVSWYNHYIDKIGEASLFRLKDYIYGLCDRIKVGEFFEIEIWISHVHKKFKNFKNWTLEDTTDLFVKIIWCYMTESNGCYCFSNDYKYFRNYIDAQKMDRKPGLHQREYQDRNTRANSGDTWMQTFRTEAVPAT